MDEFLSRPPFFNVHELLMERAQKTEHAPFSNFPGKHILLACPENDSFRFIEIGVPVPIPPELLKKGSPQDYRSSAGAFQVVESFNMPRL
jgi:hypothetical protein